MSYYLKQVWLLGHVEIVLLKGNKYKYFEDTIAPPPPQHISQRIPIIKTPAQLNTTSTLL